MRPFESSDAQDAFSWFSDPEVMRYIPFGPDSTVSETSARISHYIDHQNTKGFSKWIIFDRESQKPIGDSGFYLLPDGKRIELGYRLARDFWGRGLATEVGQRWIEVANEFTDAKTIYAFAHPENESSFRVMRKLGFEFLQNENLYGLDAPLYSLRIYNNSEP
jgi:[ribosomal protein S5]-alanine N-acetyltransferase